MTTTPGVSAQSTAPSHGPRSRALKSVPVSGAGDPTGPLDAAAPHAAPRIKRDLMCGGQVCNFQWTVQSCTAIHARISGIVEKDENLCLMRIQYLPRLAPISLPVLLIPGRPTTTYKKHPTFGLRSQPLPPAAAHTITPHHQPPCLFVVLVRVLSTGQDAASSMYSVCRRQHVASYVRPCTQRKQL